MELWKEIRRRIHPYPGRGDGLGGVELVGASQVPNPPPEQQRERGEAGCAASAGERGSEHEERAAAARLADQRRLACMRAHPSNGTAYRRGHLRQVLLHADDE